jgi:putative heme-binding domain-containing protein
MIYLGDNWPDAFRGHLFTHNLHGHQINHQINERLGSGFNTVHAGQDIFFCTDPKYVAVDLQYGPDGAVYVIDWYDQQHCHNPNTERWDRANGRIYRLQYDPTYQPHKVDLGSLNNERLVGLMTRKNDWYGRTAQRLLQERAAVGQRIDRSAVRSLRQLARTGKTTAQRLRGMWTLHTIGEFSEGDAREALGDADEYLRAWTIQLSTDDRKVSAGMQKAFISMAKSDPSAVVRLYLASAIQRLPRDTAWELIEALASRGEDVDDRNLPSMIWYGLAPEMSGHLEQAFALARNTRLPRLADNIHWFAATLEGEGLNMAVSRLKETTSDYLRRRLTGLELAMKSRANVRMPSAWPEIAARLYANPDVRVVRQAERLAAVFGDQSMFPRLRAQLGNAQAEMSVRQHAFSVLSRAQDRQSLSTFVRLMDEPAFRTQTIPLIARFDSPEVSTVLLQNIESFGPNERAAALNALTSRPFHALALLDAVAAGKVKREHLTAYHVRQMTELKNPEVDKRVVATWGRLQKSPAEKLAAIDRLEKGFNEAPLWAYSAAEGRKHFQKLCISCHKLQGEGTMLGPDLTGAGRNGIRYFLENVIDPNAVIGADFQMTTVETKQGDVVSGLLTSETATAVTLRTTVGETIVAKADVVSRSTSERSLMPEGLLESLNDREQIELLKFLSGK